MKKQFKHNFNNLIEEAMKQVVKSKNILKESVNDDDLWAEVIFVQGGDDIYDEVTSMFDGEDSPSWYCEGNSQPVIDFLKQWDEGECEVVQSEPNVARHDTVYRDENGPYILRYNSVIGGAFLLYRPANEQEIDWWRENVLRESKQHKSIKESVDYDDYGAISNALAECGWAYSDAYEVTNRNTGQMGVRYIVEPYPNNLDGIKPCDVEEMKEKMLQFIGSDNVIFSEGQHRYASEIKNLSMVVFENDDMMESKKYKNKIDEVVSKTIKS